MNRRTRASVPAGPAGRLRAALLVAALAAASFTPAAARAASNDVDEDIDGRFIGYGNKQVAMESRSTTLTYLAFFGLATIGCIPLFKAAKRD